LHDLRSLESQVAVWRFVFANETMSKTFSIGWRCRHASIALASECASGLDASQCVVERGAKKALCSIKSNGITTIWINYLLQPPNSK
jgi:hypothetical protein